MNKRMFIASVIGMAVDYLTRFVMGTDVVEAFKISCMGGKSSRGYIYNKNLH